MAAADYHVRVMGDRATAPQIPLNETWNRSMELVPQTSH
jgi:hypothetical protein